MTLSIVSGCLSWLIFTLQMNRAIDSRMPTVPRAIFAPHSWSRYMGSSTCCSKCATRRVSTRRFSSGSSTCGTP